VRMKLSERLQILNPGGRREPSAPVRDCDNCGRPTTGNPFCQRCKNVFDKMLDDIDRLHPELHIKDPEPEDGPRSDPAMVAALGMSILAAACERDDEGEDDRRHGQDRFDGGRLS
jgi:hypothetical protein